MKKFTALALVAGLAGVSASDALAINDLVYDAADGSLTIVNNDGAIINYVIEVNNDSFIGANHVGFLGGTMASTTGTLSESNPFAPATDASYNLGAVLPAGLSQQQLLDALSFSDASPKYVTGLGQPKLTFNIVPEPTSLALLGLGGLIVARRRRWA